MGTPPSGTGRSSIADDASGKPPSDASLLRRYRRGESDAATALYLRYAERLRSIAERQTSPGVQLRVDPDDIVQSVFRTFFRRAAEGEYEVPAGDELWKLVLVIGLNKIRAVSVRHKAAKRDVRRTAGGHGAERLAEGVAGRDDEALRMLETTIDELLTPLPPVHRAIIEGRVAGDDVATIAARVGRSKRSVERILQEFRQLLHGQLHESN